MKRNILKGIIGVFAILTLTGCGERKVDLTSSIKLEEGAFSIVCSGEDGDGTGVKTENTSTYNFNDDQYLINYSVATKQTFTDKETYNTYKTAQEETVKGSTDTILYELLSDDKSKTLLFTMAITDIDLSEITTEEEKDYYKASTVLERADTDIATCKVNGIDKNNLK